MSLPNYLARIKSAGMYRFTFDKSQIPPAAAETMRLVIGYSDKGPFNNPVYIDNKQDFINLFGNINKRLEKKGVYFNRMALQALSAGPILALNLKPFSTTGEPGTAEAVDYLTFNPHDNIHNLSNTSLLQNKVDGDTPATELVQQLDVVDLFDRDRFWKIDVDQLPYKIHKSLGGDKVGVDLVRRNKYINIAATDIADLSCTLFIRKCNATAVKQYAVTVADWYKNLGEDIPDYLVDFSEDLISDYFAEVYVFRGKFSPALIGEGGSLSNYFRTGNSEDTYTYNNYLSTDYVNAAGNRADALAALANDENSNCIGLYRGCLLPYFKDQNGSYISLDIVFNADKDNHKMVMKLDDSIIDDMFEVSSGETGVITHNLLTHWANTGWGTTTATSDYNSALEPIYISGYTYGTINKKSSAETIYKASLDMLLDEGIFEALTNHVDSEYHYIVDTFATLVKSEAYSVVECGPKANIAMVAKAKDNCLAIMNAPAMSDLQRGIYGFSMKEFDKGAYKTQWCLPSETTGASYCAFYTPLVFGEGAVKSVIPSAAIVSNNFMEKWNSRQPYYIVAGPNYGSLSYSGLIGPDYNYSRSDLDVLEPMGINAIVYVPRKGTYINSNQTAKQTPISALSKVHVRELVIYLQNEIEAMMQNYQWEMNTQTLRDTIKTGADLILDRIMNNGGVYAYLNVCDSTNNTPEVIDNEMVILDTSIEPARGAGKMIQRLTIHKTGGISSVTN